MYDEKHRFFVMNPDPNVKIRKLQKGIREHLLCKKCESQLSVYEKYVKEFIYDGKDVNRERKRDGVVLHGLDYKTVRLYYLSLLWRMSISTHKMFRNVSLGPHEERIRGMLLAKNPGEPDEYGFFCTMPLVEGRFYEDFILEPEWIREGGHRFYRVVIGGLLYSFTTNPKSIQQKVYEALLLQKNGDWIIPAWDVREIPYLNQWFTAQATSERIRNTQKQ